MNWWEYVILTATLLTAFGAIGGFFYKTRDSIKEFFTADIKTEINDLKEDSRAMKKDVKRVEIMTLIRHSPDEEKGILEAYDIYKNELHGNSYICEVVAEWKRERRIAV